MSRRSRHDRPRSERRPGGRDRSRRAPGIEGLEGRALLTDGLSGTPAIRIQIAPAAFLELSDSSATPANPPVDFLDAHDLSERPGPEGKSASEPDGDRIALPPLPNLTVSGMKFEAPNGLTAGAAVFLRWADTNLGGKAASVPWYDRVVIVNASTHKPIATAQILVDKSGDEPNLEAGEYRNNQVTFRIPDGPDGIGLIQATVIVDATNTVVEDSSNGPAEADNSSTIVQTSEQPSIPTSTQAAGSQFSAIIEYVRPTSTPLPDSAGPTTVSWAAPETEVSNVSVGIGDAGGAANETELAATAPAATGPVTQGGDSVLPLFVSGPPAALLGASAQPIRLDIAAQAFEDYLASAAAAGIEPDPELLLALASDAAPLLPQPNSDFEAVLSGAPLAEAPLLPADFEQAYAAVAHLESLPASTPGPKAPADHPPGTGRPGRRPLQLVLGIGAASMALLIPDPLRAVRNLGARRRTEGPVRDDESSEPESLSD